MSHKLLNRKISRADERIYINMDIKILDEIKNMVEKATLDEYVEAITNFKNELTSNGTAEIDETRIEAALLRKLCEDETRC